MNSYALIVGIDRFLGKLTDLEYVKDDIADFDSCMLDNFGIPRQNISTLYNEQATYQDIMDAVDEICRKAETGDRVFLYFSTHGKVLYNTSFVASYDADNSDRNASVNWICTGKLLGKFHDCGCNVLGFFDACQSTTFLVVRNGQEEILEDVCRIEHNSREAYTVVFAAAGEHESAYQDPEYRHGCWTYYLLKALAGYDPGAFVNGSDRITLHSLQSYLKAKVPARVRELYGKVQTPYLWGTYSDDLTINEYPERKPTMKIKEIFFGEIDTDSEKMSVPEDSLLSRNFYDLNGICEQLTRKNSIQIIIGNKGTGKTYLGEYLSTNQENIFYKSIGAISQSDIGSITNAKKNERGKYTDAWFYTLYTVFACIMVEKKYPGWEELDDLLSQIYGRQREILYKNPIQRSRLIFNKKLKNGVKLSEKFEAYLNENNTISIPNLVMIYEDLFNMYFTDTNTTYFLIDGLDELIRGELSEMQKNYLLDLLDMVQKSQESLKNLKFILMFRKDILHLLSGEANLNKIKSARTITLSWLSTPDKKELDPLYQLIKKRVITSQKSQESSIYTDLDDILPSHMNGQDTWAWILELTTYTPRDVISFFNECKKIAGEQNRFTEDNFWAATRGYSEYFWKELQDVLGGTRLSGNLSCLEDLLNNIGQIHTIKDKNIYFKYSDFKAQYDKFDELNKEIPLSYVFKTLYEVGITGVRPKNGKFYWYFRENPIPFDDDVWKEASFIIHKGLWKHFHIW